MGRLLPGIVPELEERDAAAAFHVPWPDYQAMPRLERIDMVAAFRLIRYREMHGNEASRQHMKRQAALDAQRRQRE